jgi:transglutaminase-like putative cysteine protease
MNRYGQSFAAVAALFALALATYADDKPPADSRTFEFRYAAKIEGLPDGAEYRLWIPLPPSNAEQTVTIIDRNVPPGSRTTREVKFGNELLFVASKTTNQPLDVSLTYKIKRMEVRGQQASKDDPAMFLKPDARVPVGGKSLTLLRGKELPADQTQLARLLYDTVFDHMRYSKEGIGWGFGDANWACDSGFGNCSDFHSLFISLARAKNIPAKFEIGYGLPPKHGEGDIAGYHCWAKFQPTGQGWLPVDISEARKNPTQRDYYFGHLTPDRVMFTTGRDLVLEPKQDGPPINFMVNPYVEVGGKMHPAEKIKMKVSYRDEE